MKTIKEKQNMSFDSMKEEFGYKNKMAAPKIVKVVIATATGSAMKRDKNRNTLVMDRLAKITGQKPSLRSAKKSVASFKIREGDPIGVTVTLRGKRMNDFLEKLLNVAIPRTKDFRGIDNKIVDAIGNITIPIKEHSIFPEIVDEDIRDIFGLGVTIVTTAKTRPEALKFFELIGVPFKKTN